MNQVDITNISKSFDNVEVLNDINLVIERGSFTTLLGPSGCGKTTLLRIIAGLEHADTGCINAGGLCYLDSSRGVSLSPQARKLGFVFQDYGLWPHMSVTQNVAFPLQMAGMNQPDIKQRVNEVLGAVQLTEHADKKPNMLSGGQKQRVSIARAIAAKPGLILFDEPLSNLDANLREELGQEIRLLAKRLGLTCINVTHDRREAQVLSDQIALMKSGRIHQLGSPEELFRAPVDAWTARFLDAGNLIPVHQLPIVEHHDHGTWLVPRNAFRLSGDNDSMLNATVLGSQFIEDRFEVVAELNRHDNNPEAPHDSTVVKLFASRPVEIGDELELGVDRNQLTFFEN